MTRRAASAKDIGRQLEDNGLVLAEVETVHGWSSSGGASRRVPAPRGPRLRAGRRARLPLPAGDRLLRGLGRRGCASAFGALCDRAAAHGLLVGVEWLPYTNIATAADAQAIVEAAGRPNGGYCADIWHHRRGAERRLDAPGPAGRPGLRGADGRRVASSPSSTTTSRTAWPTAFRRRGRVRLRAVRQTAAGDRRARADLARGVLDGAVGSPGERGGRDACRRCDAGGPGEPPGRDVGMSADGVRDVVGTADAAR